jgi:hypothetical protein
VLKLRVPDAGDVPTGVVQVTLAVYLVDSDSPVNLASLVGVETGDTRADFPPGESRTVQLVAPRVGRKVTLPTETPSALALVMTGAEGFTSKNSQR